MLGEVTGLKIKILEYDDRSIRFLVENIPLALLNAIRRLTISDVPSMAIDYVYFIENSSPLYDEIVAHRLGLIPLTSDRALEKYGPPEECRDNEERPDCYARLYLEAEASDGTKVVYSGDLVSDDEDVQPVYKNIPIVVLGPGQKISFEARARLGRGREHAKWSPVSAATHKYVPQIIVNSEKCYGESCAKCVNVCPKNVLKIKDGKLVVEDELSCSLCRQCEKVCPNDAILVSWKPSSYIMYVESTGVLRPERIVLEASRILEEKAEQLLSELER